jgi:hypothetical protein
MSDLTKRETFLLQMYQQMWNNINRHILVAWQSLGILGGAFAVSAFVERHIISLNWAATILVMAAAWQCAHAIDAGNWYNRNLAIIANIEKQFLDPADEKLIHPFFAKARPPKLLAHLSIQALFGIAVATMVLLYHFEVEVVPGFHSPMSSFDWHKAVPYVVFLICLTWLAMFRRTKQTQHKEHFLSTVIAAPEVAVQSEKK